MVQLHALPYELPREGGDAQIFLCVSVVKVTAGHSRYPPSKAERVTPTPEAQRTETAELGSAGCRPQISPFMIA